MQHKARKEEIFMCRLQWQRCVQGVRALKGGLNTAWADQGKLPGENMPTF